MATVINDITIEPKTTPPAEPPRTTADKGGGGKPGPEFERVLDAVHRQEHERSLRLWAH